MSTKIKTSDFLVQPGDEFTISDWPTKVESLFKSKKQYRKLLREQVEGLSESQRMHYASDSQAVLIVPVHPELLRSEKLPAGLIARQAKSQSGEPQTALMLVRAGKVAAAQA